MSLQVPVNLTQTNGYYTLTVPSYGYQNSVSIDLAGAGGGAGGRYYGANGAGGNGGRISGTISVSPGDVITVYVGDGGKAGGAAPTNSNAGGAGGYGGVIGDTYGSGTLYPVTLSWAWSGFMNTYAVWVNPDEVNPVGQLVTVTRIVDVPYNQNYSFEAQADNHLELFVDNNNILNTDNFQGSTYQSVYLTAGRHTITMNVENYGGPAGFAITMTGDDGVQYWNTRTNLSANSYKYNFFGGTGGNTYGDGGYVYPAPGGGGGASAVFLNGNLILVAGGGGGGGSEGGHGAGGSPGGDAGSNGGGSPYGTQGQPGSNGSDIAGTPGGGGGYNGGSQGGFVGYDDAPSTGANGGTNYNALNLVYNQGSGIYVVPAGVYQLSLSLLGGGGGGASATANEEPVWTGGGGGSGYTTNVVMNVTPGQQIAWSVGAGGGIGSAGGPTSFGPYIVSGGQGGTTAGGAGGNPGGNGTYVDDGGDGWNQSGGAGGYPNGGAGGGYSEDAEQGYPGSPGGNGSISIQIGSWSYGIYSGSGTLGDGLPGYCNLTFTRLGAGSVKVNGNWKLVTENYVKVNNDWKVASGAWTKVNGEWKLISSNSGIPPSFTPA